MPRWTDRNLTVLELAVALLLIAVCIGIFSRQVLKLFARAESTMVNTSILNMNTAVKYHAALAALNNDLDQLAALEDINPMLLVRSPVEKIEMHEGNQDPFIARQNYSRLPGNYIGVLEAPVPDVLPGGQWYYDNNEKMLIYLVSNSEYFYSDLGAPARIRLETHIDYEDVDADGRYNPAVDKFRSITLRSPDHYKWLVE